MNVPPSDVPPQNVPPSLPPEQAYGPVPNYMAWAIVATIVAFCTCCFIGAIPGVVAIVFASQVDKRLAAGDRAGAEDASRNAKLWCWITTGLAILGLVVSIAMQMMGYSAEFMREYMDAMGQFD